MEAHTPLVFSAALRFSGGDVHLAQDIAQTTFISLAQQARHLSPDIILSAWLYRHACLTARHSLRADGRRRVRESAAALMNEPAHDPWPAIAPVLDDAMAALSGSDRTALVLRYFENQDLRTVGHTLGLSDDAAQKRVARALERLRSLLTRRGAVISTAALATVLGNEAASAAIPPGLAATLSVTALTAAPAAATAAATGLSWKTLTLHSLYFMKIKQAAITLGMVLAALIPMGMQYHNNSGARSRVAALTTSVESMRSAVGPASDGIARSGGRATPASGSSGTAAEDGIDLAAWAELLGKGEPGSASEMAKMFAILKTLKSLDLDSLEGLILAAEQMDLPATKRRRLIGTLLDQLSQRSLGAAVPLYVRMAGSTTDADGIQLTHHSGYVLGRWMAADPEAAEAWFAKAKANGEFETKSISSLGKENSLETVLQQQRIAGLLKSRPETAEKKLKSMPPGEAARVLNAAGNSADPALITRLAKLLPAAHQPQAFGAAVRRLASTDPAAAASLAKSIDVSDREKRGLLVDGALSMADQYNGGRPDWKKLGNQTAWLRQEAPQGHPEKAIGAFLGSLGNYDVPKTMEAFRQEIAGQTPPNPVLTGAFARALGMNGPAAYKEAITLAEGMPAGEERDRAFRELKTLPWANPAPPTSSSKP